MKKILLLLPLVLISCNSQVVDSVLPDDMLQANALIADTQKQELSDKETASLLQMREEEKLAHDVYITLYNTWKIQAFQNIAASEQTHTDAVKSLIERYGLTDPAKTGLGEFSSPEIQKLYNDLVQKGSTSALDALIVGATIEDLDIYDLQTQSKNIDNQDILLVYSNLERGSRNHLRSFTKNISSRGGTYTPQYISQEEYQNIISTPTEKGGQQGRGNSGNGGNGRGNGGGNTR